MMRDVERKSSITDNNQDSGSGSGAPNNSDPKFVEVYQEVAIDDQSDDSGQVANFVNEGYLKSASLIGRTDPTAHIASYQDGKLAEFFARKVRIETIKWDVGTALHAEIKPQDYWNRTSIINKLDNYYMISYTLNVEVVINATPFHYDKLILYGRPCPRMTTHHNPYQYATNSRAYIQKVSHLMNVVMDVSTNESGALELPFIYPYNYQRIQELVNGTEDDANLWTIGLASTSELGIANPSSTTSVNVGVYMWATDVQLIVPTQATLQSGTGQGSRSMRSIKPTVSKEKGVVETVASSSATIAKALTNVPVIGEFAGAAAATFDAVGSLASFVGLSRPANDPVMKFYKQRPVGTVATTVGEDPVDKLTVDPQQGVSIDPGIVGTNGIDELSFASMRQRESLIAVVDWDHGVAVDSRIFWSNVTPMQANPNTDSLKYCLNPLGTVAAPFKYWSGSIKYRFSVVRSAYHNGRIRITYDPRGQSPNTDLNTSYSKIIDISETPDFEFCVPWAQVTPYLENSPSLDTPNHGVLVPPTYDIDHNNGRISITIINELTSPDDTAPIHINVYMSGGDDFEVAMPFDGFMRTLTQFAPIELQSTRGNDVKTDTLFGSCTDEGTVAMKKEIYFGETYSSFKSMMKRYHQIDSVSYHTFVPESCYLKRFRNYPRPHGDTGAFSYLAPMSVYELATNAFGFSRGGLRYKYVVNDSSVGSMSVYRQGYLNVEKNAYLDDKFNDVTYNTWVFDTQGLNSWLGLTTNTTHLQQCVEFELPFYTDQRFVTTNAFPELDGYNNDSSFALEGHALLIDSLREEGTAGVRWIQRYFAPAEDFQTYFFMGNGPLYVRT